MTDSHIHHDGVTHHPLGAGSSIFKKNLIEHITQYCTKPCTILHIGAQPNSSPHVGTLVNFSVAFALAKRIREDVSASPRNVLVSLDLVDTAPSQQLSLDGIKYQRSHRYTREMENHMGDFRHVMESLHSYSGVPYRIRTQEEFLSHPDMPDIVQDIVQRRTDLAKSLAPERGCLAIRATCPRVNCGLSEKYGTRNVYNDEKKTITFYCPSHGEYTVDIQTASGVSRLEFSTPMRNILRAAAFERDKEATWIHVPGADYAGYYQEQLLWRHIHQPYLIFYSPLILDWSGAKLSKSLYKKNAYKYLVDQQLEYLVSFEKFKEQGKYLRVLYDEVTDWVENPFKLFRSYSVEYMNSLFQVPQKG